jgi:hypothetical protein
MPAASSMMDAETIRQTAAEVIRQPKYKLDATPLEIDWSSSIILRALRWILSPFIWLDEKLHGLPETLRWLIIIGLAVLLVLLIVHLSYTLYSALRGRRRDREIEFAEESVPRDPAGLERQAHDAAGRGDYIGAVRLLFRACLRHIEQTEHRALAAGATNREVLRRHRDSGTFAPLKLFVDTIETKWYGRGACGSDDYAACRVAYLDIVRLAGGAHHAHSA